MIEKYIEGQKLNRTKIALDIKNGLITHEELSLLISEIDEFCSSGKIDNPYLGSTSSRKLKKTAWDKKYLDSLVGEVSCSEIFNRESLKYLCEVSAYVKSATKRFFIRAGIYVIAVFIIFLLGFFVGRNNSADSESLNTKKKVELLQQENKLLKEENESLNSELIKVREKSLDLQNKVEAINSVLNPSTPEKNSVSDDELTALIKRALNGENIRQEFQNSVYSTYQVEERAQEMKLNKAQAKKLVENMVTAEKFHMEKFGE